MGTVGASAFRFIKGIYNSPAGVRLSRAFQAMPMHIERYGEVWADIFRTFDLTLMYARDKDDLWNAFLSASATTGLCAMVMGRRGLRLVFQGIPVMVLIEVIEEAIIDQQRELTSSQILGQSAPKSSCALEAGSWV